MSQISPILRDATDGMLLFWCPGCDGAHGIKVGEGAGPRWGWNGSIDKPTFSPSILVRSTEMTTKGKADHRAWCDAGFPKPAPEKFDSVDTVCHSFVDDGRITFLGDCTHAMANQTVDLPGWTP